MDKYDQMLVFWYICIPYTYILYSLWSATREVYVDITMKAAKENDEQTAEQATRESVRVARCTRELLKRFSSAYHLFHNQDDSIESRLRPFSSSCKAVKGLLIPFKKAVIKQSKQ